MQFKISAAAFLAFAASALAQNPNFDPVYKPTSNEKVNAGSSLTIEWDAPDAFKDVTVAISLIGGATQNTQVPLLDIVSGIPNSAKKYTWAIPSTLGKDAFYGLVIKSEANPSVDFQYSNPFHICCCHHRQHRHPPCRQRYRCRHYCRHRYRHRHKPHCHCHRYCCWNPYQGWCLCCSRWSCRRRPFLSNALCSISRICYIR
ncbi:hypothetical protein LY76DRAFT_132018 [Colletotrichum caudatum]|nr:hypothetical protein LY76DRAFT_132018 [Colletotrichum caudatum]